MDDLGMVSMFQALMESGLAGFLDCPAVIYEAALVDFFENASVREGVIISTVAGQLVEISEEWFAESFDLPVDGLSALSEIPKDKIFDARSIVSLLGEPAGSFNAIIVEKFSMVTAVVCGVRMNWARVLFNILKKMVTPGSNQAKGFAAQISLMLENIPNHELGESSEFPASKILTEKTVHHYVSLNDKGGAKEAADAPLVKKEPQKRPAVADFEAPVIKKKRTMKKKSGSSKAFLEIVAVPQEAVGDATRINEPTTEPAVTEFVHEESSTADDVDIIIEQVLADTAQISVDEGEQVVRTLDEGNQPVGTAKEPHWFDLPYDDLIARWDAERPVVTASDTDEDVETMDVGDAGGDQQVQFSEEEPEDVEMSDDEQSVDELIDADENMSLEDILVTIPVTPQNP
ncbi:dystroglycan-like [Dorcoceras hygrometricum]|uniref:Dystroglycan-like n=1 Tax=Dorcoceras hygrometricum TaxID=472368 RepID=A0A2Z7AC36_9LAMI|nr:dystroglycan-like [Dorcoceras hygrometricum]